MVNSTNTANVSAGFNFDEQDLSNHIDGIDLTSQYIELENIKEFINQCDKYACLHVNIQGLDFL